MEKKCNSFETNIDNNAAESVLKMADSDSDSMLGNILVLLLVKLMGEKK